MAAVPGQLLLSQPLSTHHACTHFSTALGPSELFPFVRQSLLDCESPQLRLPQAQVPSTRGTGSWSSLVRITMSRQGRHVPLQAIAGVSAVVGLGTLIGLALTLLKGGPAAVMSAVTKSGFSAAFALIFVSEIGDKTFFIAALLAMRQSV